MLTARLPALLLLAPALLAARDSQAGSAPKREISVASLLPPGSLLSGVMLPRYDENRHLLGVMRAKTVTLVTSEILDGEAVSIELYNPDRSLRARMDLTQARFDQVKGLLRAKEAVTLSFDSITANGTGLICEIDQAEGFLMGPTTTRIKVAPKTTMYPSESSRRATALLGASLLALPISVASGADPLVEREDAASSVPRVAEANAQTRGDLRAALSASAEATRAASDFLEREDLLAKAAPAAPEPVLQARPLDVKPGPEDTVVNCDGGMYFDADKGLLVYLKNVTVADPRFTLDGANEIKVFFEKKPVPAGEQPKPGDKPVPGGITARIGDVERVVATGAVHLLQKPDGTNETIEAAGAIFTYNFKTGEIVLSGGKPWVKKGGMINRAKQSDQTIRVIEGKFTFSEGGTETILPLEQMNRKTEEKKPGEKRKGLLKP